MKRKFYLYAGYYELYITDRRLSRPYLLVSTHRRFDTAKKAAVHYDPDAHIIYDNSVKEQYIDDFIQEYGPYFDESEILGFATFFDGADYDPAKRLTKYTVERLERQFDSKATFQCVQDITAFLVAKTGKAFRTLWNKLYGKTYKELFPVLVPYWASI